MLERSKPEQSVRTMRDSVGVPLLVAHRGAARDFPENTLPALQAALRAGACWVEFDVQLCADLVPVLLHDADLRRTAGFDARITDLSLAQVRQVSVHEPHRFGARHHPTALPTLAQVAAELAAWPQVHAFVEIKHESVAVFGVATVLDAVLAALAPVRERCVLICHRDEALAYVRERASIAVGWILRSYDADTQARANALAPDYLICNHTRLPPAPTPLWPGTWCWVVYEIDTPHQALALAARGVDIVESFAVIEMLDHPRLRTRNCLGS